MNNEWICKKNSAEFTSHVECGKASNRRDRKSDHGIVYCVLKSAKVLTLQSKMRYLHELTGFSSTQVVEDECQQPEPQNIYISTESSTLPSWHTWQLSASLSINQDSSPTMRSPCRLKRSMRNTSQNNFLQLKASHNMKTQKPPSEHNNKV